MKTIFLLLALLVGMNAGASGKLSYTQYYYDNSKEFQPMLGLSIYQKLSKKIAYNSWTGWGRPDLPEAKPGMSWYTSKQGMDFYVGRFTINPGFQFMYLDQDGMNQGEHWDNRVYVKVDYQLW